MRIMGELYHDICVSIQMKIFQGLFTISKKGAELSHMENTAKNFALQLGSLVSLYVSITALITLLFGVITIQYPDAANGYWEYESASSSIRVGIAMLVVFFPAYLVLTRLVNTIRRTEHGTYLNLTKWLIYISLLIGGATILGDLVMTVNAFLNGELTIRFILKALVFLLVVGSAFIYYLFDARGYWQQHESHSIQYALGVLVVVVVSIVGGFMKIEPPTAVREMKIDETRVMDLMSIQNHVEGYYAINSKLPASIEEAFTYDSVEVPTDPQIVVGNPGYTYEVVDETKYTLCAWFYSDSVSGSEDMAYMYQDVDIAKRSVSWSHPHGLYCYTRFAPQI